jgi:hypothetical protein
MRANARALAEKLSRTAMDYDQAGRVVRVTDAKAQAELARAFELMLQAGGEPQVVRISDSSARAWPRGGEPPIEGATAWLAVGIDRAGMATYCLRWLQLPGLGAMADRRAAEVLLKALLAVECATPGYPVAGHA